MSKTIAPSAFFAILADETRLRILNLLADNELRVSDLTRILDEPQPKISRHLAALRELDLVETRRHGKCAYYQVAAQSDAVLRGIFEWLKDDLPSNDEREKLRAILNQAAENSELGDTSVLPNMNQKPRESELAVFLL